MGPGGGDMRISKDQGQLMVLPAPKPTQSKYKHLATNLQKKRIKIMNQKLGI